MLKKQIALNYKNSYKMMLCLNESNSFHTYGEYIMENHISILTVCKNSEKTISKTLDSVYEQNIQNLDYVIVDGQSLDETLSIIEKHPINSISKLKIHSKKPSGVYDALNYGSQFCEGRYILIVHSNDFILKDTINEYNKAIENYPNMDVYYSDALYLDTKCDIASKINAKKDIFDGIVTKMNIPHSSMLIKTELIKQRPYLLKYKIASDYEMLKFLIQSKKEFKYLPMNSHTITDIGISNGSRLRAAYEVFLINREYEGFTVRITIIFIKDFIMQFIKKIVLKIPVIRCLARKLNKTNI